ncbi:MAG: hypothetical protein KJ799_14805 [Bacteroidetes bacterium]|nr:hypothetical protein [Bacteroidota bacterium]MBU1680275.1 hypothetical protein [Bacteroidota bacterium]MBU2507975.1 hypothetical protein [Bacteroidota bacterium]
MKNEKIQIPCPGGGKPEKVTYKDLCTKSSIKTQKGEYKFKSNDRSKLNRSIDDIEKYQKEYENKIKKLIESTQTCVRDLLKNADVTIKK